MITVEADKYTIPPLRPEDTKISPPEVLREAKRQSRAGGEPEGRGGLSRGSQHISLLSPLSSLLFILTFVLTLTSCTSPTPEELASLAAKGYYDHLIHGEYEQFLEGVDVPDYLDQRYKEGQESYYDQQLDNYRQFMATQKTVHGGIREVRVVRAATDSVLSYTNVFLTLCFGDSTNEEIVVPMVERDGRWRMR